MRPIRLPILLLSLLLTWQVNAQDIEDRLRTLETQVRALQRELAAAQIAGSQSQIQELERRLQLLAEELEQLRHGPKTAGQEPPRGLGLAPAAQKVYGVGSGVSLGGYGEALYQNFASRRDDRRVAGKVDTADALRFVLYAGYKFSPSFVFNSELELEHANSEKGEVELEFAYIDHLIHPSFNFRAGMLLVPLGLINEFHEPTTFLSTRRSETETRIIPSTWRELGVGAYGDVGSFSYRTYLITALDSQKFSQTGLRAARQGGAKAKAETLAWVGRLDWTATPGLAAGIGTYLGESGQELANRQGGGLKVKTSLLEAHLHWQPGRWSIRGLWAQARLGDVEALNQVLGLSGSASIGKRLRGGYVEIGYDLLTQENKLLAPFARWEKLNTQDRVPRGYSSSPANDQEILTLGLAYQPLPQLIFKADWHNFTNEAGSGVDQWNLALGYVF